MTTGAINQMQMVYIPEEDRILFRINSTESQEFRFWVTRRYSMLLLQILKLHVDTDPDVSLQPTAEARQAVREFKKDTAIQQADFNQAFQEDSGGPGQDQSTEGGVNANIGAGKPGASGNRFPLGGDALLAFKANYRIEGEILHLGIEPKEGQGINLTINRQINLSLTQLLYSAADKAAWLIDNDPGERMNRDNVVN